MSLPNRRTIDQTEASEVALKEYKNNVRMLAALVLEMVKDDPKMLLSPNMRELLVDKAQLVKDQHFIMSQGLCVDAPCTLLPK
jgi:hypothetical protein